MNDNDEYLRFEQRREKYNKALRLLLSQYEKRDEVDFDEVNVAATLQFFAITFELGWKLLKDYLEINGISVSLPRVVIQEAFNKNLIDDGHMWIEMMKARNQIAHTYDEVKADKILNDIMGFFVSRLSKLKEDADVWAKG